MDHGLCFIRSGEDLTAKLANIDKVKDDHVYGLFPDFLGKLRENILLSSAERLLEMDLATAREMVATVPMEWDVSPDARNAWAELIHRRADYVAKNICKWIEKAAPWFGEKGE